MQLKQLKMAPDLQKTYIEKSPGNTYITDHLKQPLVIILPMNIK